MRTAIVISRLARLWVAGCAVAAIALALCFHVPILASWWVELLRYLPFPVFLAPALVAVVASLALPWGWRVLSIATAALVDAAPIVTRNAQEFTRVPGLEVLTY